MKSKFLLLTICLFIICSATNAQKNIKVKKGNIYNGEETVAEYDGKGGAFRYGKYKVTLAADTTTQISFTEFDNFSYNPFYKTVEYPYEVKFASHPDKKFYFVPPPYIFKLLGKLDTMYDVRKHGGDLMDFFFNDTVPFVFANKKLDNEKVEALMKRVGYDYEGIKKEQTLMEDTIGMIAKNEITRDKSKPCTYRQITDPNNRSYQWFMISQGGVEIGKIARRITNTAYYEVWKKAPAGTMLRGKPAEFVPIAIFPDRMTSSDKMYDLIKVAGKEKIKFTTPNITTAETDIVNTLISYGLL